MNKAILMGRLTRDPELKSTNSGISLCTFTIAIDRRFKNAAGERETDFIPIVTWRQTADFVSRYFRKGSRIALVGSIQVRSWDDKDGNRRYITEVVADEVYFADSKSSNDNQQNYGNTQNSYGNRSSGGGSYGRSDRSNDNDSADDGYFDAPDDETALPFDL